MYGEILCTCLAQRRPRPDELEDDGVSVLLDAVRDVAVHHHLVEFVPTGADVVHEDLVWRQLVFDGRAAEIHLLQLDAVPELVDDLHPQSGLPTHRRDQGITTQV